MANQIDFIVRNGLQVTTNAVIGTYAMTNAAPINGLIVSGSVGIGTAAPSAQLEVRGNIQITNTAATISGIRFADGTYQNTSAASYSTPPGGNPDSVQYNAGGAPALFGGSGNFVFHSGNTHVGIGTNKADYALVVSASDGPALFSTQNAGNSGHYQISIGTASGNAIVGYNTSSQSTYLGTNGSTSQLVTVKSTGEVGIGASAPLNKLDVSGGAVVGSGYAGVETAPTDGMAIQGNVAIGSASSTSRLYVSPAASQTALQLGPVSAAYVYIQALDAASQNKFVVNSSGNITTGGWQGNVIAANYGGTGLTTYTTGDMLYATSSSTTLSKLPIGQTGNVLFSDGTGPYWSKISLTSSTITGVLPISKGGTNSTSFSASSIVTTASDGLSMSSLSNATNAAVVFDNTGVPATVTGGPYTYLTTGSGGGNLAFGKVDLVNGVNGTLMIANGGTGTPSIPQYALLYGSGNTTSMGTLVTSTTSALVTGATGAPQWALGPTANRVLRTDGTSISFAQVALTTDVSGVLPYANGGTNASTSFAQGSIIFAGASSFAQNNSNLYWDNSNGRLGLGTASPTTTLDVNGAATIRNGANVVAGGLYVQSGESNFTQKVTVGSLVSNAAINAGGDIYGGAIYSNSTITGGAIQSNSTVTARDMVANLTVTINGTNISTDTSTGALVVAGGVGIAGSLNVGQQATITGDVLVLGNLDVRGNTTVINTDQLTVEDPLIELGTGPNGANLTINDGLDRGLLMDYYDTTFNHAYLGRQSSDGRLLFVNNVQPGESNVANPILSNSPGYAWGTMQLGNIFLEGAEQSTSASTGTLVITGAGGVGIGGSLHVGEYAYVTLGFNTGGTATVNRLVSNTSVSAGTTISAPGQITGGSIVSNSSILTNTLQANATIFASGNIVTQSSVVADVLVANTAIYAPGMSVGNVFTANIIIANIALSSNGPISAIGSITGASLTSNSFVSGTSLYSSGPISAVGNVTGANITSNGYVQGSSIYSTGPISSVGNGTFANVTSNGWVQTAALNSSGQIIGASVVSNGVVSGASVITAGSITGGTITGAVINSNAGISATTTISAPGQITGGSIVSNSSITGSVLTANSAVNTLALTASGSVSFTSANTTTSATTGALVVTGGIATSDNLYVAGSTWTGNISVINGTASTGIDNGALVVAGGAGIGGDLWVGGMIDAQGIQGTAIGNVTPSTAQFTTLQTQNTATVNALISNSFVNGTSLYSSGPISAVGNITGANIVSNGYVQGASVYSSGAISAVGNGTFANVTSNGFVNGASVYSSGSISAVGTATANRLQSNTAVIGDTIQGSTSMLTGTFVANTSVTTASLTATGTATVNKLVSDTSVQGNAFVLNGNVSSTSTTGALTLDSFTTASYRTAHYLVQVTDNTNSQYHSTQIMLIHNGATVFQSEYNIIYSDAILGTFDSTISGGTVQLQFTPSSSTNKTVKVLRTAIEA